MAEEAAVVVVFADESSESEPQATVVAASARSAAAPTRTLRSRGLLDMGWVSLPRGGRDAALASRCKPVTRRVTGGRRSVASPPWDEQSFERLHDPVERQ